MQPDELIRRVSDTCERLGLEYFVTGSVASMYYGEPRFTRDVDVMVELPSWKVREFCDAFPAPEFYVDPLTVAKAATSGGMFNILQSGVQMKADIICFDDKPFDNSRLSRRRRVGLGAGLNTYIASAEDVILKKLEYYRMGGSDKHLRDITSIIKVGRVQLDVAYIEHWALRLGVVAEWRATAERAGLRSPQAPTDDDRGAHR